MREKKGLQIIPSYNDASMEVILEGYPVAEIIFNDVSVEAKHQAYSDFYNGLEKTYPPKDGESLIDLIIKQYEALRPLGYFKSCETKGYVYFSTAARELGLELETIEKIERWIVEQVRVHINGTFEDVAIHFSSIIEYFEIFCCQQFGLEVDRHIFCTFVTGTYLKNKLVTVEKMDEIVNWIMNIDNLKEQRDAFFKRHEKVTD